MYSKDNILSAENHDKPNFNCILLEDSRRNVKLENQSRKKIQLPGGKSRPAENIFTTAKRICNVLLGINTESGNFSFTTNSLIEDTVESNSYPGVKTLYRKHLVDVELKF